MPSQHSSFHSAGALPFAGCGEGRLPGGVLIGWSTSPEGLELVTFVVVIDVPPEGDDPVSEGPSSSSHADSMHSEMMLILSKSSLKTSVSSESAGSLEPDPPFPLEGGVTGKLVIEP